MNTYTIFAIDMHGNHFCEEYTTHGGREQALEGFYKEYADATALFIVDGAPDFEQL